MKTCIIRADDFGKDHSAFAELFSLAERVSVPLNLGAIPSLFNASPRIPYDSPHCLFQHGYEHVSHSPMSLKKNEFPEERKIIECLEDIQKGREILKNHPRFFPAFCPPWNRMRNEIWGTLPELGYKILLGGKNQIFITGSKFLPWDIDLHTSGKEPWSAKELQKKIMNTESDVTTIMIHPTCMDHDDFIFLEKLLSKLSPTCKFVTLDEI